MQPSGWFCACAAAGTVDGETSIARCAEPALAAILIIVPAGRAMAPSTDLLETDTWKNFRAEASIDFLVPAGALHDVLDGAAR